MAFETSGRYPALPGCFARTDVGAAYGVGRTRQLHASRLETHIRDCRRRRGHFRSPHRRLAWPSSARRATTLCSADGRSTTRGGEQGLIRSDPSPRTRISEVHCCAFFRGIARSTFRVTASEPDCVAHAGWKSSTRHHSGPLHAIDTVIEIDPAATTWTSSPTVFYGPDVMLVDSTPRRRSTKHADTALAPVERLSDSTSYALVMGLANRALFSRLILFSSECLAPYTRAGPKPSHFLSHGPSDIISDPTQGGAVINSTPPIGARTANSARLMEHSIPTGRDFATSGCVNVTPTCGRYKTTTHKTASAALRLTQSSSANSQSLSPTHL